MSVHSELVESVIEHYGDLLAELPQLAHDAVTLRFHNGMAMEFRFATREAYLIRWLWQGHEMVIDTAPLHKTLSTFPNHFHDGSGNVRADPVTEPGRDPWENVRALLNAVVQDPGLGQSI